MRRAAEAALACLVLVASPSPVGASATGAVETGALARGDRAWQDRAASIDEDLARPDRIEEAVGAYGEAAASDATSIEARWKLLRALHFLVDFTHADEARKEQALAQAVAIARNGVPPDDEGKSAGDRAQLHFWTAIVWGVRGQRVGLLTIVREGVASRIREHAEHAAALDPTIERGGAWRLLSRLHGGLPRVPFVSGWVDRERTLPLAERALAVDSEDPGNRLVLAMALLERAPDRSAEAREMLEIVSQLVPRQSLLVEDLAIREQARELLGR